jgi:hypothetical protein
MRVVPDLDSSPKCGLVTLAVVSVGQDRGAPVLLAHDLLNAGLELAEARTVN